MPIASLFCTSAALSLLLSFLKLVPPAAAGLTLSTCTTSAAPAVGRAASEDGGTLSPPSPLHPTSALAPVRTAVVALLT